MSEDMVMGYRTGRYPITEKAWRKLSFAEVNAGINDASSPHVATPRAQPQNSESDREMLISAAYAPKRPEPNKADCLAHLQAYLEKIQDMPGGVSHTWVQLQLHFPLEQAERMAVIAKKF